MRRKFKVHQILVFGSTARGESAYDSDLDVLVILTQEATHRARNEISDIAFDINLNHSTNISIVVFDEKTWNGNLMQLTPFYSEVIRDGISVYESYGKFTCILDG